VVLVNGNIEAVQKEARKDKKILQVLVWRFMSSAKHQDQLMYTLTQLLRYFGKRCAARSEEHIFSHLIAHFVGNNDDSNHFLENALTWGLTSFTAFTALLSDVKQILNKFYEDTVVRTGFLAWRHLSLPTHQAMSSSPRILQKIKVVSIFLVEYSLLQLMIYVVLSFQIQPGKYRTR
jgi:hypothetical protein